jgi:type VI secretion system secreted protein Hcp
MAVDMFLKLDGIEGETLDAKHKDEIDVLSFHWGVDQQGSALGGGGAGKVVPEDLVVAARYSKASPKLMLACCTGQHIPTGVLTLRRAGENQLEFLKYKLSEILVSAYQTDGEGEGPSDQVSFNFVKIEIEYTQQKADGSPGEVTRAGFDFGASKKV